MFVKKIIFVAAAASLLLGGSFARAQDNGALLDLLVRKKIITDQEAEEIRGELTRDFSQVAAGKMKFEDGVKQYSQCPLTKDNKERPGDMGQFPYKFVVWPEFSKTAFALKKGELSDIVQTAAGLHLIWVTDRTAGEPSTFEALKETVREIWAQEEDLYARILTDQQKNGSVKRELP